MSRINESCNLTEEEQERVLKYFGYLDSEEERELSGKFTQYCFYENDGRSHRFCVCTSCGPFDIFKGMDKEFFQHSHRDKFKCPNCGEKVTLYAMGRMRSGNSLEEWQRAEILRAAPDGGLLIAAGYGIKRYSPYELRPVVEWVPKALTYLNMGKRMQWEIVIENHFNRLWYTGNERYWRETVKEPFCAGMTWQTDGSYWLIGLEQLANTNLRYCQLESWYEAVTGEALYGIERPVRQIIKYLAKYTAYPAMEMAVKLGYTDAVTELALDNRKNHRYINWGAKSVDGFLRLPKEEAKAFVKSGMNVKELIRIKETVKTGTAGSVMECLRLLDMAGSFDTMEKAGRCGQIAGAKLEKALRYIGKRTEEERFRAKSETAQYWLDYLRAAKELEYDLGEQTVAMPKNLRERHDNATSMLALQKKAIENEAYEARRKRLERLYCFQLGGLGIYVPESGQAIIEEGKTLHHCVGGYAERHIKGKVDILFLRNVRKPGRSFLTIEMEPRKKETDAAKLVQIHGYKNECYNRKGQTMKQKYKWFLDEWFRWMLAGSRRDKNGNPVMPGEKEKAV